MLWNSIPSHTELFPSRRTRIGSKLACVTGRPSRYWQPTLRILGTSRKKRRAMLLAASLGCKIRSWGNMYPVCHVALVSKSWWWARRVTLSLLSFPPEKSVPVDTLCTRYSKKYNAWMDLSWKKNEIKYGIMVRVMRIFLHIHISFGHEFIWTIDFGKIKLIKKWSLKIILLLWYTLVRGSRQVLKFLIWIDITMA